MSTLPQSKHDSILHSASCYFNKVTWRSCLALASLITTQSMAYTTIEPPVPPSDRALLVKQSPVTFRYSAELHSDLIWQGISLTSGLPGWASKATFTLRNNQFNTFLDINGYAYTTNPSASKSENTQTDIAYMMTQSKFGSQLLLGTSSTNQTKLTISQGIFTWPGSEVWEYTSLACTDGGGSSSYLRSQNPIKPVKSFDITLDYAGMTMAYSTYSTSSKNQSATESNEPISTRIWGDYYHIESKKHSLSRSYHYNLEFGYWNDTGQHLDFNLYIDFDKDVSATIKTYDFKGKNTFSDNYGMVFIMNYHL